MHISLPSACHPPALSTAHLRLCNNSMFAARHAYLTLHNSSRSYRPCPLACLGHTRATACALSDFCTHHTRYAKHRPCHGPTPSTHTLCNTTQRRSAPSSLITPSGSHHQAQACAIWASPSSPPPTTQPRPAVVLALKTVLYRPPTRSQLTCRATVAQVARMPGATMQEVCLHPTHAIMRGRHRCAVPTSSLPLHSGSAALTPHPWHASAARPRNPVACRFHMLPFLHSRTASPVTPNTCMPAAAPTSAANELHLVRLATRRQGSASLHHALPFPHPLASTPLL